VSEGLEHLTPFGFRRINAVDLGPALMSPERTAMRAVSKRPTGADIVREVMAPDGKRVADGLTQSGKPISFDEASGERARRELEERDRRNSYGIG
jgi:hypothetical protein